MLVCLLLTPFGFGQALQPGGPADFGTVAMGSTQQLTLTFSASTTTTISSVIATTNGTPNKDYTVVFQTCTGVQSPPESCNVTIQFSPLQPGLRKGALVITDSTGTAVNRVFLHGIGLGPQIVFSPAPATVLTTVSPFSPSGYSPSGAAISGSGDVYFNDAQFDRILKQNSAGTLSVVDLLFSSSNSEVAIDGAGTLYITAGTLVYTLVPGGVAKPLVLNNGITLTNATGIAVDGSGFIYISDTGQNHIVRVGQDGTTTVLALFNAPSSLLGPTGIAIDTNFLYIADTNRNRVLACGLFTLSCSQVSTGSLRLSLPLGVVADPSGALSITDTSNKRIVEVPPSGAAYVLATPGVTFDDPVNISVKDNGDLVVADAHIGLVTLVRSVASLTFPTSTGVGHLDTVDGALPFEVMNSGNVPLQLTIPATGANPVISNTAFATTAASTCPLVTTSSTADASTQLTVGEACDYTVSFTPSVIGPNSGTAILTASPVGGGVTLAPVVTLNGTGIPNITKFSVTATPTQIQPGTAVSFTVSALDASGAVDPTYRGTATFTSTDPLAKFLAGTTYTFTAADNGTHTFTAPTLGAQLNTLGTYTISATDGAITGTSNPIQVVQANGFTLVASPSTIALGDTVSLTVTATFNGVPATGFTGTLTFSATDPAAKFLSGTTYKFTAADNGTHTFAVGVGVQFNTTGVFTISATDGLFTGTSNNVTVSAATSFTITASPTTILKGGSVSYTVTALFNGATATNFTGPVTFTTTDTAAAFATTGNNTFTYTFTAADNGTHTFTAVNGVQFNTLGVFNISAAAGGVTGTSNAIKVVAADSFTITAAPTKLFVGQSAGYTVTAMYQGAVVPNYTGTVTFSTGDASAKFVSTTYTFTAADNGSHTFTTAQGVQYNTPGTYTIGVTDGVSTGVSNQVVVVGADGLTITATPTKIFVGQSAGYTVTVTSAGAPVTNFTGTVTFTTTDATAKFLSGTTYTFTAADNGTHTFTAAQGVQFNTAGTYTITVTSGALSATSNQVQVVTADGFTIVASPTKIFAGQSVGYTVTATSQGATVTSFTGTVTFTTGDAAANFLSGTSYTFTAADNGVHTFTVPQGVQFNTGGTYTITATSGAATGISNPIQVVAVDGFTIVASPTKIFAGQTVGYTVTATAQGVVVPSYTGTVTFATGDTAAKFLSGKTYTFTAADAGSHTFAVANGVQYNTGGTYTITATSGAATGTSNSIQVVAVDGFTIVASPTKIFAGQSVGYTVTATAQGVVVPSYTGTVTFATGDAAASFLSGTTYTFTAADAGVHTFAVANGVQYNTGGTYTITATAGTATGTSNSIQVIAVDGFTIVAAPTKIFAGQSVGYTVTATAQGTTVTNYTGTVTFTTGDAAANFLSGKTYTFTAADNGVHTFTVPQGLQFNTGGTYTITATSGAATGVSNSIQVIAVDGFTIVASPTKIFAGQTVGYTVTATAQGVTVPSYTGTVTFATGDAAAKFLSGTTYTFTAADAGSHTFAVANGVQYNTGGTYTITATAGAATGTSNSIQVIAVDGFTIVASPTKIFAGQSVGYTVTATSQGTPVTNYTGTVTFATGDPAAKFLSGTTYTFTAADNGVHTFAVVNGVQYNTGGTYTITATAGTATGTSNSIQVLAVDGFTIVASPTNLLTGQSTGFTITATSQGATVTNYTGTVTFATGDATAKFLSGTSYTFTAADNGTHTFTVAQGVQYNTAGVYTITATSGAVVGTSNQITVIGVDGFTIVAAPANLFLGQDAGYTVTAMFKGAVATGFTGTVTFSVTDPLAVFLGPSNTYTFTAADNGTHTFAPANGVQFNSLGTFTINATDGTLSGVSNNIVVTNPTGVSLTSSANPVLIGTPITLTATVAGQAGVTGTPNGTITFYDNNSMLGSGTLVNGVATLSNVLLNQVGLHPLSAVYSGSTSFSGSQSASLAEIVEDFSIVVAPGTYSSASALVGHTVTYTLLVSPVGGLTFAAPVTFTLSQELKGAKVVFTPTTLATGAQATNVTLDITPTQLQGALQHGGHDSMTKKVAPVAFALLLLPLFAVRRKKFAKLLMLVVALLPMTLMTGCLSSATDGYYGAAPVTYTLTVTAASGTITHSTQITISVQ